MALSVDLPMKVAQPVVELSMVRRVWREARRSRVDRVAVAVAKPLLPEELAAHRSRIRLGVVVRQARRVRTMAPLALLARALVVAAMAAAVLAAARP
jgi:CMP-2-keto-3-deoxyoctulosonic acid synthetase